MPLKNLTIHHEPSFIYSWTFPNFLKIICVRFFTVRKQFSYPTAGSVLNQSYLLYYSVISFRKRAGAQNKVKKPYSLRLRKSR